MKNLGAVIICGDRNWAGREAMKREVAKLPKGCVVIEGAAKGADTMAMIEANKRNLKVIEMPANWARFGRAAGPQRNRDMLDRLLYYRATGNNVAVWAFHNNIEKSKGTKNMVTLARKAGVDVEIITE